MTKDNNKIAPLNDSQRGVYFECIESPESTMYNIPVSVLVPDGVDAEKFGAAVLSVAEVHPSLRATVDIVDGEPSLIQDNARYALDIAEYPSREQAEKDFVKPFDLKNGPLARFEICRTPQGTLFLFDIHHLVFDGCSLELFLRQIAGAYEGKAPDPEQMTLARQCVEEKNRDDSALDTQRAFWREMLEGVEPESPILPDISRNTGSKAGVVVVDAPAELDLATVDAFARKLGITRGTFFMGAFSYALTAFSGTGESFFTMASSGRKEPALKDTVGMFVRTLPVRMTTAGRETVAEYLQAMQELSLKVRENQDVPFSELAAEYGINANISFAYQSRLLSGVSIGGKRLEPVILPMNDCQCDIICMVIKGDEGYRIQMYYRAGLYTGEMMENLCGSIYAVAASMLKETRLAELDLLTDAQRNFVAEFNHTETALKAPSEVCSVFNKSIESHPDAEAIVCEDRKYTFAQFDVITRGLAARIKAAGIGNGDFVAVLVPRNEFMALGSWGVIRAGAAFQPLDPTYPRERLEYMVADSGARLLIADRALRPLLEGYSGEVIYTDEILSLDAAGYAEPSIRPEDAITMIYTSGTTGKPKGCVLEHRNLAAFWRNHTGIMGIREGSRVASYASFGFDAGVMDVVTVPMSGATLCIIPDSIRLDLQGIEDFFCAQNITHGFMTTQLGRMFAQQTGCKTLEAFLVGGEKLVPFNPPQNFRFINGYGPCETMGYICSHVVTDNGPVQPIGRPSGDTKLYVIDANGRMLPPGAAGELCIAGCQVGRGYLGLPEKTSEVFVPNPFDGAGYGKMYRTGDVVRLLPSGELEYIGRRDGQVKIRGFRVELTEVEEVIRRFEGVSDATVAAFDDPAGGKYIAAYVVGPDKIDIDALGDFIRAEKPAYMVPAATMQIDAIPYTQNQKVNRRALPKPERGGVGEIVPPENDSERKMFDLAAGILGHTGFGVTTDLFEAGMTSIGLLKFNAGIGKTFGKAVKIADVRRLGTIRALDAFLGVGEESAWELQEDYPLMQNQMGVFVESGMQGGSLDYNIPFLMKVSSDLDAEILREAVVAAIDAHPYMKTVLRTSDDGSVRAVRNDSAEAAVDVVRVAALPGTFEMVRPFEMIGAPLYRCAIYVTDAGNYLFLDIHHIVADGTSMGILLQDIDVALKGGKPAKETYTGFEAALEEEKLRAGSAMSESGNYYEGLLAGANTECLPARCPSGEENSSASFDLGGCSAAVLELCRKNNISLNAFFNAAFAYTLSEFIHSEDVTYCTVYNGRGDSRLAGTFAMLVRTLPVCCSINPASSVVDFVRGVQSQLVSTMANDAMSFAEVSGKYGVRADIFFNYQGDNFNFTSLGGKPAEAITLDLGVAKAPLSFEVFLEDGKFRVEAAWNREMFCREMVESIVGALETVAAGFTTETVLGKVELMSSCEMEFFDRMNDTDMPFEAVPAQTVFSRAAAKNPSGVAVRTASASLTFAQLEEMSDRLASSLVAMGARNNEIIGMLLERSEYVPVAELGVLKAGCAFLPMLPGYPKERIDFCLKDAGCRFCLDDGNIRELVEKGNAADLPEWHGSLGDLAYCIYTSGSTGTPKGVMIEQHNLTNFVQTGGLNEAIGKGSSILCMASISFDMSLSEIFAPLCHGRSIYIASEDEVHDLDKLLTAFKVSKADYMCMTPSFAWSLLSVPEFEAALGNLKAVVLGAEAFQPALLSRLKKLNPDMLIQNGYGPTECTQACSAKTLEEDSNITIGGPFANTKYYVMNERGQLLPRYAVGELVICGEGVGRGYVGLPEKNKAAFLEVRGVRAYRSGDLVRINRDGEAEFGGRKDNQVKLRGFRIELDEVESVMEEFDGVTRAKVVLRGAGADAFLAGFYTADRTVAADELTAFMKTKLTYYMVPSAMMQLDRMPMTQGGKLDAKALPEIKPAVRARAGSRAPKKSLEQRILDEFKTAVGTDDIFVDDNFFEAGGSSLTASKVVMKLKAAGLKIEYQDIFDHQTAEELAEYLEPAGAATVATGSATVVEDESSLITEVVENRETLKYNNLQYAAQVERKPLGDVVLTGATGFLGCHILRELLETETGHITCLLRRGKYENVNERLKGMLFYYFDRSYAEAFESGRLTVVEGDITDGALPDVLEGVIFDTLINCAACVKHFSNDSSIEYVNVRGVENLIGVCKARGARMIQISTTSIPGAHTEETYRRRMVMHEDRLFYIDDMNNQYCQSKYKAEQLMLAAIRDGMSGKIIRVGNLMGRHSDGEFQINTHTNAFLNALRGFVYIGKCPVSHATDRMALSPVDCTARAVVLLAGTNDCFTAFHADSRWWFDEMILMESVNRCGFKVTPVRDEEYYSDFYAAMADARKNEKVSALLTNDRPDVHLVETDNRFTANILYRLGFSWPLVDDTYLDKVISALASLDFFANDR